jgi:MYXO-CTERM domain-containing protein
MRVYVATSTVLASILITSAPLVAAPAPSGSSTIVISEFRTRGPNGANDEFIELYNKSSVTTDIGGWRIMRSTSVGVTSIVVQIPANTNIPAGGFFLLTNIGSQGFSGKAAPDATYTRSIADDGGIAVTDTLGNVIDQIGLSVGSTYVEGTFLAPMTLGINQSYERNSGGCFPSQDTDNNTADFRYNGSSSYPQNSATNCLGGCADVVCASPPDPQCWVSPGTCANGSCGYDQLAANSPCTDNSVCTQGDACDVSGICQGGTPLACNTPPQNSCQDADTLIAYAAVGTCDDVAGCTYAQLAPQTCTYGCNGTTFACNPNPCTGIECNQPPNGCYDSNGSCQTGACIYPLKASGASCEDGNLCTTNDACDGQGACVTGFTVVVDDGNSCTADACDISTGTVSHTALGNGTSCDDGNLCNGVETCHSGACTQGTAVTCTTPPGGGCYEALGATCAPSTGICTYQPTTQGSSCNDGDPCTTSDKCDGNGACSGSTKLCSNFNVCADSSTSQLNWSGTCDADAGNCVYSQTNKSCPTGCDSTSGLCNADPCEGVVCNTPPDSCHQAQGTCSSGICGYSLKPNGAACDDGQACTASDQCSAAGACEGTPVACNTPPAAATCFSSTVSRSYNVSGACLPASGLCNYAYTDTTCTHGCNAATGLCADDPCAGITCDQPPSQCHQDHGTCANGSCSYALKTAMSTCDDANVCTGNDVCGSTGACAGTPVVCNNPPNNTCTGATSRVYGAVGACNSLGVCTYSYIDTACTAGCNSTNGVCNEDPCVSVTCNQPPGSCWADQGSCNQGQCTYVPKPEFVTCDDGLTCTSADACDGSGNCVGVSERGCGTGGTSGTGGDTGAGGDVSTGGSPAVTSGGTGPVTTSTTGAMPGSGGVVAMGGVAATTGGVSAATGGLLAIGGTQSVGSTLSTAGQSTTAGTSTNGGTESLGGASQSAAGTSNVAGSSQGGVSQVVASSAGKSSVGGTSNATAGATQAAGTVGIAGATTTGTGTVANEADSVQNGGCACSVPRRSNGTAWGLALLGVILLRRRRKA